MWTLLLNGTTEKELQDWSIRADLSTEHGQKTPHSITATTTEDFDAAAPQFAYGDDVIIYRDRTAIGTGGAIHFQGACRKVNRTTVGGQERIEYTFADWWWSAGWHQFKQPRQVFNGWSTPGDPSSGATYVTRFTSEVYLFERADGTRQTNGAQVIEILNWLNECFNPARRGAITPTLQANGGYTYLSGDILRVGQIDPAVLQLPVRNQGGQCSELIIQCLRLSPDAVVHTDNSTTPPTVNVFSEANQPGVSITITAEQEKEISISRAQDLEVPGVIIHYNRIDDVDGRLSEVVYQDSYPVSAYAPSYPTENPAFIAFQYTPGLIEHWQELSGGQVSHVTSVVQVRAIADALAGGAAAVSWWKNYKDKTLSDPLILPGSLAITEATVVNDSDVAVNTIDFPNELISGEIFTWMTGINVIEATIKAEVSYSRYTDATHVAVERKVSQKQIHARVRLTNAISTTYTSFESFTPGEDPPVGVAQALYTSLHTPRHAGSISFTGQEMGKFKASGLDMGIVIGTRLTLIGPNNTYTGLVVQDVSGTPHDGGLRVTFGPSAPLDAAARIEIARATRWRTTYRMPSGRAIGGPSASNTFAVGGDVQKENTVKGEGTHEVHSATAEFSSDHWTEIKKDAGSQTMVMQVIKKIDGVKVADTVSGSLNFRLADTLGSDGKYHEVKFMQVDCPVTTSPGVVNCTDYATIVAMCAPFLKAAP